MGTCSDPKTCRTDCLFTDVPCKTVWIGRDDDGSDILVIEAPDVHAAVRAGQWECDSVIPQHEHPAWSDYRAVCVTSSHKSFIHYLNSLRDLPLEERVFRD